MEELAVAQPGALRIRRDVVALIVELLDGADKMIECILLPEASPAPEQAVETRCHVPLPRFALRKHCVFIRKRHEDMHMIGHHDEVSQIVAIAVEAAKAVGNDLRQLWISEHAIAVTVVEMFVPAIGHAESKPVDEILWQTAEMITPVGIGRADSMLPQPGISFVEPAS